MAGVDQVEVTRRRPLAPAVAALVLGLVALGLVILSNQAFHVGKAYGVTLHRAPGCLNPAPLVVDDHTAEGAVTMPPEWGDGVRGTLRIRDRSTAVFTGDDARSITLPVHEGRSIRATCVAPRQ